MASPRDVREWCRATCAPYPTVEIKNMSTSFRDGLAFCAIIHRHRPDLIDFSSLCKDNVYQNNKMAFEIAERKLGIPALLDPGDMVSTKVPDCLSVVTYLSRYYRFFSRKSQAGGVSARSSHAASKTLKRLMIQADLETSREVRLSSTRPGSVCSVCFKPVHLIQRHLTDGKIYHRSCFRCSVCRSALLPDTQGSDGTSSICTHHSTTDSRPQCTFQAGYFSLGGLAISTVPDYKETAESVCKKTEERESKGRNVGLKDSAVGPGTSPRPGAALAEGKTQQEETKTQGTSGLSSPCAPVTEGSGRPVAAPRRMLDPSGAPVPAPRTRAARAQVSAPSAGDSSNHKICSSNSSHINANPTTGSPKVQTNHPWMNIIHPGPWTQLPPAPPPVPTPRSKAVSTPPRSWSRPRVPPANPFEEEEDTQKKGTKPEPANQSEPSAPAVRSESGANQRKTRAAVCTTDAADPASKSTPDVDDDDGTLSEATKTSRNTKGFPVDVTEAAEQTQSLLLPRSLSVPAIASAPPQSSILHYDSKEANEPDQVVSPQTKLACKENPFNRCDAMPKSKTLQALSSTRAPAPGHGFPLIKRKVQSDQNVSTKDLQAQMRELEKDLEALEQRGVELEGNLRGCTDDEEEDQMLMGWFSLVHERHLLMCRDTELVYLTKQQQLEERQADVEYELRCLLNKPGSDWSPEDRGREQQLMEELVATIERRNQIVSSLDQDRQREREEDMLLEDMMKNKEIQTEELKELKKSRGKFKPAKMFKMLNHKAESKKDSVDKKS
ncbi:MICAL-like protein 1 [Pungitius pungitius]|uniref:MICAL-like protein 1 n=1 Tax=Pungitius pungitius TaxID=134920 RepID=UPI002E0D747C